ncbi:MAG: putative bifunctional diguanylate cyclase/phosphodiesterase [Paracoccus sp. (in: a-proteobacteria)]|uniref:putative bifunctional diguanylate cyclase/phosphodiesterase n=1 Tax=Paracoccus sp. TaxID=267 RepID=UPI00391CC128
MQRLNKRHSLSVQITGSVLVVLATGMLCLIFVGRDAVHRADMNAVARQERFAAGNFSAAVAHLPEQQRSATIWDDAVFRTGLRDHDWMDANLGAWMQSYFGHNESYILDHRNRPFFASVAGTRLSPEAYDIRREAIAPLVMQLRAAMAEVSEGSDNPYQALAEASIAAPVRFDSGAAIVSVVPIVSDTGEMAQTPGTEALHVAVRYLDLGLAQAIGKPIELADVAFDSAPRGGGMAGIPVNASSGDAIAWLVWQPERPGSGLVMRMLPVLLGSGLAFALLIWWIIRHLLRVSGQLQVSEAQARFLANHDALTGLPNRALFHDRLAQAMRTAGQDGQSLALLAIDLDGFKRINDTLGHPAGDELIRQVGNRLSELVRASDTVARIGGDEFMLLLSNMNDDSALRRIGTKIVEDLSRPYSLLGNSSRVGASVGAVRTSTPLADPDELVRRADMALYRAKAEGKGRFNLFDENLTAPAKQRSAIGSDLRQALETGEGLRLVYQPFYDRDGQVTGAEALCRWDHPRHGPLSPEIFIRIAEERGLIDKLGRWTLETACQFAADTNLPKIAVNVSPIQLRHAEFIPLVLRTLESTGLPPPRLELELTENAVLEQSREIADTLSRLRTIGIRIALDDFATGNSSLQYLRDHRVDCLKIDRTFVARLGMDEESDRLVRAIFGLARATGISVTVEGIETEAQHSLLAAMGCTTFQGFFLSRPLEPQQFAAQLRDDRMQPSRSSP